MCFESVQLRFIFRTMHPYWIFWCSAKQDWRLQSRVSKQNLVSDVFASSNKALDHIIRLLYFCTVLTRVALCVLHYCIYNCFVLQNKQFRSASWNNGHLNNNCIVIFSYFVTRWQVYPLISHVKPFSGYQKLGKMTWRSQSNDKTKKVNTVSLLVEWWNWTRGNVFV